MPVNEVSVPHGTGVITPHVRHEDQPSGLGARYVDQKMDAVMLQYAFLRSWRPKTDTIFLTKVPVAYVVGCTPVLACAINYYYRKQFKLTLTGRGKITSYLIAAFISTTVNIGSQMTVVSPDLLLSSHKVCSVCQGTKSGLIQVSLSTIYPTILASLMGFYYASINYTIPLPPFPTSWSWYQTKEHARVLARIWVEKTRPIAGPLMVVSALQIIAACAMIEGQQWEMRKIDMKIKGRQKLVEIIEEVERADVME